MGPPRICQMPVDQPLYHTATCLHSAPILPWLSLNQPQYYVSASLQSTCDLNLPLDRFCSTIYLSGCAPQYHY